jgi:hypothetical protein
MMMAKVRFTNFKQVFDNITTVFEDTKKSKEMLNAIGKLIRDRIKTETQKGKALPVINQDGSAGRQPPLSREYIKQRVQIKDGDTQVEPSPLMRPRKSHLTLTGQLLESLDYDIDRSKGEVVVKPTGKRDDGKTNVEVTEDLATRGRTYLGLDNKGIDRVRQLVIRELNRNIRLFNKK